MIGGFSLEPVPADATAAVRTADRRPPVPPDPGTLKIELDLSSGALAAAQLFPQVKDRLTQQEYLDWTRAFLDTGDEILGTK